MAYLSILTKLQRAANARYRNSPHGKAKRKAYAQSRAGKAALTRYNKSAKGRACFTRYYKTPYGKTKSLERSRETRWQLRLLVLRHYCKGEPRCMCPGCPVTTTELLEFDHINNDGGGENRITCIALWLKRNNFPPIVRVVCPNCHKARHKSVACPHSLVSRDVSPGSRVVI